MIEDFVEALRVLHDRYGVRPSERNDPMLAAAFLVIGLRLADIADALDAIAQALADTGTT